MLLKKDHSILTLVDVQDKLTPLVNNSEQLVLRCEWLIRLAQELEVPVVVSEQYPAGLGNTVLPIRNLVQEERRIEKLCFSCFKEPVFTDSLKHFNRNQLVIIGIETHVCILQTALDLLENDYEVFVVVDAVSSRFEIDHRYGLKRMKQIGVQLVTAEMVFFEWLGQAGTDQFRELSKKFLKSK